MFAGSIPDYKGLYREQLELLADIPEEDFQAALAEQFPNCQESFKRRACNTTWKLERPALYLLAYAAQDKPAVFDYMVLQANPQPEETIGFDKMCEAIKKSEGTKLMSILNNSVNDAVWEMYAR